MLILDRYVTIPTPTHWKADDLSNRPTSEEIEKCLLWTKEETSDWWNPSNTDEKVEKRK